MQIIDKYQASVYRYYDVQRVLLYVGFTRRGARRNNEHAAVQEWWPFVDHQEVEHYPTVKLAQQRERELIREFRPPFNKQHNPDSASLAQAYLELAGEPGGSSRMQLFDILNGNAKQLPCRVIVQNDHEAVLLTDTAYEELAETVTPWVSGAKVYVYGQNIGRISQVRRSAKNLLVIAKFRHPIPQIQSAFLKLALNRDDGRLTPKIRSLQLTYAMTEAMLIDAMASIFHKYEVLLETNPEVLEGLIGKVIDRYEAIKAVREAVPQQNEDAS